MKRRFSLLATAVLFSVVFPATAQKFQPETIQFQGDPEYSQQELMDAIGWKKNMTVDSDDMQDYARKLTDTGVFQSVAYKFDGTNLIYTLIPFTDFYPIRLENLPLTPGKALDAALHNRLPLYHGKIPAEGGMREQVCKALEEMLAAKGIKATVLAAPFAVDAQHPVTAMSYSITTPPVLIGTIRPDAASATLDAGAQAILASLTGTAYDVEGSPAQIETQLGDYYRNQGYVAAQVHAQPLGSPVVAADGIHIPFQVSVVPGLIYRLAGIRLAPGLLVSQAEFDAQSGIQPGVTATAEFVRQNLDFITRQYHDHGYMKAAVHATPTLNSFQGTVSYDVTVDPGPVYTMGRLTILNVSDDLQARMISAWTLPAGAVFDEGVVRGFFATHNVHPALERLFATVNCSYSLTLIDSIHRVNVTLRLEKMH